HAVAFAGRFRPVVEHMPEMTAAAAAMDLGPLAEDSPVGLRGDSVRQWFVERRPARAAVIFRLRGKNRQVAGRTVIRARTLFVIQRAGERLFGPLLAQHPILRLCQDLAPFVLGARDLEYPGF